MMFATLTDVKARLGVIDGSKDSMLTRAIEGYSALFNRHCNRSFEYLANGEEFFCADAKYLAVRRYPIFSITSFSLQLGEEDLFTAIETPNYSIRSGCVIALEEALGPGGRAVGVTYSGGYALPGDIAAGVPRLPDDVQFALIEQLAWWYQARDNAGATRIWPSGGNYIQYATIDLTPVVRKVLTPYRRLQLS